MDTDKIDFKVILHESCIHELNHAPLCRYRFVTGVIRLQGMDEYCLTPNVSHLQPHMVNSITFEPIPISIPVVFGKGPNNKLLLNAVLKKLGTVTAHKL